MTQKPVYCEPILKALEEGSLYGHVLLKEANKILPENKVSRDKRSFARALLHLLNENSIRMVGYNLNEDHRLKKDSTPQAFNPGGFKFSLVKKESFEIRLIINNIIYGEDLDKIKESLNELRELFNEKMDSIVTQNINSQKKLLLDNSIIRKPSIEELIWYKAHLEAGEYIKNNINKYDVIGSYEIDDYYTQVKKNTKQYQKHIPEILDEFRDFELFILEDYPSRTYDPNQNDIRPELLKYAHIFGKNLNKEECLNKLEFESPKDWDDDKVFIELLKYIQKNDKKDNLITDLSIALSNSHDSIKEFNKIIQESTNFVLIKKY